MSHPGRSDYATEIARTHEDPSLWIVPRVYEPERWLGEPGRQVRTCRGASFAQVEMHVRLALLLRDHARELAPGQNLDLWPMPFPRPKRGGKAILLR